MSEAKATALLPDIVLAQITNLAGTNAIEEVLDLDVWDNLQNSLRCQFQAMASEFSAFAGMAASHRQEARPVGRALSRVFRFPLGPGVE